MRSTQPPALGLPPRPHLQEFQEALQHWKVQLQRRPCCHQLQQGGGAQQAQQLTGAAAGACRIRGTQLGSWVLCVMPLITHTVCGVHKAQLHNRLSHSSIVYVLDLC
jgi:hypothetical protein